MALRGHTFNKQLFSSDCFALFIDTFLGKHSGIINNCELSNTTNEITVNSGYFCIKGRFLQEESQSTFPIEVTEEGEKFCKLICEIDLSKENTTSTLNQAYYKILENDNDYPTLQQDDITNGSGIYQFEFARFKRTVEGITDFTDTRMFLDFEAIYSEIRRDINNFFEELKVTTEVEAQKIIDELKDILKQLEADMVPADIVIVNNEHYESTRLSDVLTEIAETRTKVYNITLDTDWAGEEAPYTKTIAVEGVFATDIVKMYPVWSEVLETRATEKEEYSKISVLNSAEGTVELICDEDKPTIELNVRLEVVY